jgi:FkbM family methyltransferase
MYNIKLMYHFLKFYFEKIYFYFYFPKIKTFYKSKPLYSQFGQDYILKNFIIPNYSINLEGTIIEIGSNQPIFNNNSFIFYHDFDTISIDPIDYSELYKLHRPNTKFLNLAVSNFTGFKDFHKVEVNTFWEDQMSSFIKPSKKFNYTIHNVRVETLNDILLKNNIKKISLLFIDVEGYEFEVLEKFDFIKYLPDILIIENNTFNNKIRSFLFKNGYHFKYRLWTCDDVYLRLN